MRSILAGSLCAILMTCASARSLVAQSSVATNPQQAEEVQPDSPALPSGSLAASPALAAPVPPVVPELDRRMFGMIPDFETTNDVPANHRPLTRREKYILALHQAFDISAHVGNAFQSALQQANDAQPNYGEGWAAYGKRFAASEGDQISGSILIYGVLPSILHEDPRYFRRGRGSTLSRIWYAANRTVVARRDDGTSGFNNSQIFGQLFSSGISASYYPQADRTVARVFCNWLVNLGGNSAYNVLSEYYPDLKHLLLPHHRKPVVEDSDAGNR